MTLGARVWQSGLDLVGARFRLQGRDAATGLDCIGVVVAAYGAAGVRLSAIDDYGLRGVPVEFALASFASCGLRQVERARVGSIALFALPAGQLHVALIAPARLIHADALLRRVVEAPSARLPLPIAYWHWPEED